MKTSFKHKRFLPRCLHKPYIKNHITFTSELYPNDNSSRSIITTGASGSFSIKLMPLIAILGFTTASLMILSKLKMIK